MRLVERFSRGFTFIELMVSLAIVAVLATAAVPLLQVQAQRHKERELRRALLDIRSALDAFKQAADAGRLGLSAAPSGYPRRLEDLEQGVRDQRDPQGGTIYFLRRLPRDPFFEGGSTAANSWRLRSYESPPDQPAPGADVFDVRSSSDRPGLNGVPYGQW